jgi:Serine dehydrogenase proteinase
MNSLRRLLKWIFSFKGFVTLLFILFFVAPIIESWRLTNLRERVISALEKKRGSRVIVVIHRQESINVVGIPLVRYIDIEDSEEILRAIRLTDKNTPLDFVLHTPGGWFSPRRRSRGRLNAILPGPLFSYRTRPCQEEHSSPWRRIRLLWMPMLSWVPSSRNLGALLRPRC